MNKNKALCVHIPGQVNFIWFRAFFTGGQGAAFGMCDFLACNDIGSNGIVLYGTKYGSIGYTFKKKSTDLYLIPKRAYNYDYYDFVVVSKSSTVSYEVADSVPSDATEISITSPIS